MPVAASPTIEIRAAEFPKDFSIVREIFRDYASGLGVDLAFQGFAQEVSSLPGKYVPPSGRLLLAWRDQDALGSVALRAIDEQSCEMKRLYVRPAARGEHLVVRFTKIIT